METSIESLISFLEETNDPTAAYFSFGVDDTGEYGVIEANQQGLRLYAAEMLRKSIQLQQPGSGPVFFEHKNWLVSDAGYDLIRCVVPHEQQATTQPTESGEKSRKSFKTEAGNIINAGKGCFLSLMAILMACTFFLFAAIKWFR